MANKNPSKETRFKKGNQVATKNKGKKQRRTIVKEIITDWSQAERIVEQNILELIQHPNLKVRVSATKAFAEFTKPKKREITGSVGLSFADALQRRKEEMEKDEETSKP